MVRARRRHPRAHRIRRHHGRVGRVLVVRARRRHRILHRHGRIRRLHARIHRVRDQVTALVQAMAVVRAVLARRSEQRGVQLPRQVRWQAVLQEVTVFRAARTMAGRRIPIVVTRTMSL